MTIQPRSQSLRFHLIGLLILLLMTLYLVLPLPDSQSISLPPPAAVTHPVQEADLVAPSIPSDEQLVINNDVSFDYQIQNGDTLSDIFSSHDIDRSTLNAILDADGEKLTLDILRPGSTLIFTQSAQTGSLQKLSLVMDPARTVNFEHAEDGSFHFEDIVKPTHWQGKLLTGVIDNSFYVSASAAGLTDADIMNAQHIFDEKINFRRDIRPGDWFEIVLEQEMTDTDTTGQTRIKAILFKTNKQTLSAFLYEDGKYYDQQGQSLTRSLLRYPMKGKYRVSSPFNLKRLHPITKQVMPHYGVDFAMPVGTPVLSTGDGVVTRVGNHPYAGKYVEIDHQGPFKTRYLHLSKILVKQGQHVNRGEKIALSGNTGRTTGPHLHFELHIHNHPVDPLTAKIPTSSHIPKDEMAKFTEIVDETLAFIGATNSTHLDQWQTLAAAQ